jgi:serine/threonine protein kinase
MPEPTRSFLPEPATGLTTPYLAPPSDPHVTRDDPNRTTDGPTPTSEPQLPVIPGFALLRELGRGGMGVVYQARQLALNRDVALKAILQADLEGSAFLARFWAKAQAVASIDCSHVVRNRFPVPALCSPTAIPPSATGSGIAWIDWSTRRCRSCVPKV